MSTTGPGETTVGVQLAAVFDATRGVRRRQPAVPGTYRVHAWHRVRAQVGRTGETAGTRVRARAPPYRVCTWYVPGTYQVQEQRGRTFGRGRFSREGARAATGMQPGRARRFPRPPRRRPGRTAPRPLRHRPRGPTHAAGVRPRDPRRGCGAAPARTARGRSRPPARPRPTRL